LEAAIFEFKAAFDIQEYSVINDTIGWAQDMLYKKMSNQPKNQAIGDT
jgi:hypothetical protein